MTHPKSRILSDAQLDEMAILREKGWSPDRIAEHFTQDGTKVSASAINWQCLKAGADAPIHLRGRHTQPDKPYQRGEHVVRPYTAEEDALLIALDVEGATLSQIAKRLGRKVNSVIGRQLTLSRRDARAEDISA